MAITDLTGTSWEFNNYIDISDFDSDFVETYSIDFDSNLTLFDSITFFFTPDEFAPSFGIQYLGENVYSNFSGWLNTNYKTISITGGTDTTNTDLINWLQENATQIPTGYSITYHSDGGTPTPEDLTGQTALPDPLPTISKSNYIFDGWYLDSAFETPAVAGATISADTDLYAKFTEDTRIHCNLTQLAGWADLSAGQHTITVKAKATGYRDSEPSTGVTVTKVT